MSTTGNDNADWGLNAEIASCDRWPLEHVANEPGDPWWHDAVVTEPIATDSGAIVVEAGTPVETKACRVEISDGARAGRWWFRGESHDRLLEESGEYALAVYDVHDGIRRLSLISSETVDCLLADRWTSAGPGHRADRCAQLPWSAVFDDLDGGIDR